MSRRQSSVDRNSTPQPLSEQRNNQRPENSFRSGYPPQFNGGYHQNPQTIMSHSPTTYGTPTRTNNPPSYDPRPVQASTTHATSYTCHQHPQQSSQYFNHPQSNASAPWTPAPTTSDVHNRKSRSNSASSLGSNTSSVVSQYQPPFAYSEMLSRYLTISSTESSLVHEARRAISGGLVQDGEDMFARRSEEQGWRVRGLNGERSRQGGQDGSDGSRTLGRSRDGEYQQRMGGC